MEAASKVYVETVLFPTGKLINLAVRIKLEPHYLWYLNHKGAVALNIIFCLNSFSNRALSIQNHGYHFCVCNSSISVKRKNIDPVYLTGFFPAAEMF